MSIRPGVLMMTSDSATAHTVAHVLTTDGHALTTTAAARDFAELLEQLKADPGAIAVVDLDPDPTSTLNAIGQAIERFPTSRFVGVTRSVTSDLLLDAMQSGVRRVLPKSALATELPSTLNRLCPPPPQRMNTDGGQVITVLAAGGGAGATTIAVNLAFELAFAHGSGRPETLLIDFDTAYGAAAIYCGLAPQRSVAELLHSDQNIDNELLQKSITATGAGLHLLASPASLRPPRWCPVDFSRLGELIAVASCCYRTVIVDAPPLVQDVLMTLVGDSDVVLLVMQLNVKDLRIATAMLDRLQEAGVARDRVITVGNRIAKEPAISLDDAARVIGMREIVRVREDAIAASECVNSGKPLAHCASHSSLRADIRALLPYVEARFASLRS